MATSFDTRGRQRVTAGRTGAQVADAPKDAPATQHWITGLSLLVALLALVAATSGIVTGFGHQHVSFVTLRGDLISIQGAGLYAYDSVSAASQAIGQDFVTLLIGVPLLLASVYLAARGSLRGRIARAGALWYFAYTYLLMMFGAAYNPLFLVYVALFSASLSAFILSLLTMDIARLPSQVSPGFLRRTVAWMLIVFGGLLALLWLGRIAPSLTTDATPQGLDSYSTLFVQAGDLGLVVPLAVVSGVLLLRRHPAGYLLTGVMLVKGATFGLALGGMMVAMMAAGTGPAAIEVVFFVMATAALGLATAHFLASLRGGELRAHPAVGQWRHDNGRMKGALSPHGEPAN